MRGHVFYAFVLDCNFKSLDKFEVYFDHDLTTNFQEDVSVM